MQTTELIIPQAEQLEKLTSQSGLELNEGEQIKQSYLPYFEQLAEIKSETAKINFDNPSEIDEKMARELRLKTVKIRTGSEKVKEERKRIHSLKANLEQSAWNLIKSTCELEEEKFAQVEKHRANLEKARIEALHSTRAEEIQPYAAFIPVGLNFGIMSDDDFGKLLSGAKLQHQAKVEAEAKAELERIERERKEAEERARERERIRIENELLKKEADEREAKMKAEREEAEKKLAAEKAKAEKERKEAEEKARKEREEVEAKLAAERKERERIEQEAKAKAEAEAKAKKEAEEAAAKAERERIAAEKKAAKAPDNEKIKAWIASMQITDITDTLKQPESKAVASVVIEKFNAFKKWAESQITE